MTLATVDDIAAGLSVAQIIRFFKYFSGPKAAGAYQSAWTAAGIPAAGATPPAYNAGSGYTCDKSTTGAMAYANGSTQNRLARAAAGCGLQGSLIICDRLWACSNMGTSASTYTVTTPGSLPARITDGGLGCELWLEYYGVTGVNSATVVANYKDSATNSKASISQAAQTSAVAGQTVLLPLADNLGISQLTSIVQTNTLTSGNYGATIRKRLIELPVAYGGGMAILDWATAGLPSIPSDACLELIWLANGTATFSLLGSMSVIDK